MSTTDMKDVVREKYAQAALRAGAEKSCCCGGDAKLSDPIT